MDTPLNVSNAAELPGEISGRPASAHVPAPAQALAQFPAHVPAPAQALAQSPAHVPAPAQALAQFPAHVSAPAQALAQCPAHVPAPAQALAQSPAHVPAPAQALAQCPPEIPLADLATGAVAQVVSVAAAGAATHDVGRRLAELGFLPGERLRIVARGFMKRDPIAVRIGTGTFALRLFEAACIRVRPELSQPA